MLRNSPYFDEPWYREQTGIPADVDAASHYYHGGWRQSDPSTHFDQKKYQEVNIDVGLADVCPLAHYLFYGRIRHRPLYLGMPENLYRRNRVSRGLKRIFFELVYAGKIRKNRDARILVVVHVYYVEAIGEIIEYLKNLRKYHYDLVITTVQDRDVKWIRKMFTEFRPDVDIRVFPNNGFDIGPFISVLNETELEKYDVILKLHSKRSFPKKGTSAANDLFIRGKDWFLYLYESTLGARWVHRNVDDLCRAGGPELIGAKNLLLSDPEFKERLTIRVLNQYGIQFHGGYSFVAGTCFVCRASALRAMKDLHLTMDSFGEAERGVFTFAHALERYMTGMIDKKEGRNVCLIRQTINRIKGREALANRGFRLRYDSRFTIDDDFMLRFLEHTQVYAYDLIDVPVNTLYVRRIEDGEEIHIPLRECSPYLYLKGDREQYQEYVSTLRRTDYMLLTKEQYEQESSKNGIARFEKLREDLDRNGYDPTHPIVIREDGEILDGQHRACWYLYRFGENASVKVLSLCTSK